MWTKKSQSMYEWMNNKAINESSLIHLDVKLPIIFYTLSGALLVIRFEGLSLWMVVGIDITVELEVDSEYLDFFIKNSGPKKCSVIVLQRATSERKKSIHWWDEIRVATSLPKFEMMLYIYWNNLKSIQEGIIIQSHFYDSGWPPELT